MAWQEVTIAAALVAVAIVAGIVLTLAWRLWRDPWTLVRAEYARQRRALGLARRVADIDGLRWVYVEHAASAPGAATIVMLHGYTGSKENWYRLARRLRGRHRLVIPDLPGWGDSPRDPDADFGYAAQASRVAAFIRTLIAATGNRPVVLLGHSMGGGIAAVVAARHPDLVARVGLLNASGVQFDDNPFGLDVLAGNNPFGVGDAESLERYLDVLFHDRGARPPMPWPAPSIVIARRRNDADFEQSILDRIGRGEEQFLPGEEAGNIRQPALLLWGAHDRVIDPSAMAQFAARMPQARTVLLDGSGHMSLMEQPDAVAAAVNALIEREPVT